MNTEQSFPLSDENGQYTKYEYRPSITANEDGEFVPHAKRFRYCGGGNWDSDGEYGEGTINDGFDTPEEATACAVAMVGIFAQMEAEGGKGSNDRHYWVDGDGEWHLEKDD